MGSPFKELIDPLVQYPTHQTHSSERQKELETSLSTAGLWATGGIVGLGEGISWQLPDHLPHVDKPDLLWIDMMGPVTLWESTAEGREAPSMGCKEDKSNWK